MATIRIHVDVDRPVEKVFAYVADIRNDVHWWRGVISAERLTGDGGPGTEYAQDTRLFGVRFPARMVVLEVEAPRRFLYRTTDSLTPFTAEYTITPL
ncbi:MAG: hypothetical protein HOV83_28170, partial [Catenulispora sp.]|nr:hypothetical protein [Catenulispora sp.]